MRVAIRLTSQDARSIFGHVAEKSRVALSLHDGPKEVHFSASYPSYEEAIEDIKKVEVELKKACGHPHTVLVREDGAKDFRTEREYLLLLVRERRELHKMAEPLANLAKSLAVS
jgi:hypothetical protein